MRASLNSAQKVVLDGTALLAHLLYFKDWGGTQSLC